jgi:Dynein heavy chain C-terminal domain
MFSSVFSSSDPIELDASLSNLSEARMSSFTVLLVHEIHSFNRMVVAMREGFLTCLQAMRGTQVMSQYVENLVACISSDILMPEIKVKLF